MLHNPVYRSVQFTSDEFNMDQQCGCNSVEYILAPGARQQMIQILQMSEHIADLASFAQIALKLHNAF